LSSIDFSVDGFTMILGWPSIVQSISTSTGSAKIGLIETIDIKNNIKNQYDVNIYFFKNNSSKIKVGTIFEYTNTINSNI